MSLSQAASAMNAYGDLGPDARRVLIGAATDSRLVRPGQVFFCIPGTRFDGHEFADKAAEAGAAAIVASRPVKVSAAVPVLMVPDTLAALGALAGYWRDKCAAGLIAVTGSAGKTTVKDMLASVMARAGKTAKSYKNFNNQIGLPLSILKTDGDEEYLVMEAGISRRGDMDELGEILAPDLVVITNVGQAHLEGLGTVAEAAEQKTRLLAHLRPGGKGLVCVDYPELWDRARAVLPGVIGFTAKDADAPYKCRYLGPREEKGEYELDLGGEVCRILLPWRGRHFAENLIAVASAAREMGATRDMIREGVLSARLPEGRFECRDIGGWRIVDDSYNANPLSMVCALDGVVEMTDAGAMVLVLGDMAELGEAAAAAHEDLGKSIARTPCRVVFYHGVHADDVQRGLESAGWAGVLVRVNGPENFITAFKNMGLEPGVVLFKGSRVNKLEEYADRLKQELTG